MPQNFLSLSCTFSALKQRDKNPSTHLLSIWSQAIMWMGTRRVRRRVMWEGSMEFRLGCFQVSREKHNWRSEREEEVTQKNNERKEWKNGKSLAFFQTLCVPLVMKPRTFHFSFSIFPQTAWPLFATGHPHDVSFFTTPHNPPTNLYLPINLYISSQEPLALWRDQRFPFFLSPFFFPICSYIKTNVHTFFHFFLFFFQMIL